MRMIKTPQIVLQKKSRRREIMPFISRIIVYKGRLDWIQEGSQECCKQILPANLFFLVSHERISPD
ncbi:MAG: hypothetical protein EBT92_14795 [Planctomycetes bacterium]|nr:hypothetical protein [Planctomycetota bacterium]NBY01024.1 hypothetical protein [Planctomycetota bacterium]